MVNYTTAARDVETGLGQETVVLVEKKSSTGWMGKLVLAMFLVAVCCAGALLFAWYWNGRQEMQVRVRQHLNAASEKKSRPGLVGLIRLWLCRRLFRAKVKS